MCDQNVQSCLLSVWCSIQSLGIRTLYIYIYVCMANAVTSHPNCSTVSNLKCLWGCPQSQNRPSIGASIGRAHLTGRCWILGGSEKGKPCTLGIHDHHTLLKRWIRLKDIEISSSSFSWPMDVALSVTTRRALARVASSSAGPRFQMAWAKCSLKSSMVHGFSTKRAMMQCPYGHWRLHVTLGFRLWPDMWPQAKATIAQHPDDPLRLREGVDPM